MKASRVFFLVFLIMMSLSSVGVQQVGASSEMWSQTYGGSGNDPADAMIQTSDGGYALAGWTGSFGAGSADFWLVKTDANGNMEWNQTYGGTGFDHACSLVETSDGFALAGSTNSYGAGYDDFWLVKTDKNGNMMWNRTYGGADNECAYSLVETSDGGFALAGSTSFGADDSDFWLVKTDVNGIMMWNQTYRGARYDTVRSLVETSDGGFALAGNRLSFDADYDDFWLVKTDVNGNMEWSRTYGGARYDSVSSLVETSDGGYALAGSTNSYGAGYDDFWLVKTDAYGNMMWNRTYGGADNECAYSLVEASDGGFALAGYTNSYGAGYQDFWLVKTDAYGNMMWNQTYGGTNGGDLARSLVETPDGGFALAGYTNSFGAGHADYWLVMTDGKNVISVVSPENKTYIANNVSLTFTVNKPASWIGYSLDAQDNVTINGNRTLTGLPLGEHNLIVYARDVAGNTGSSETIYFTIAQKEPFPTTLVAATTVIAGIAVVGAVLLIYFGKVRRTTGKVEK